ncbi:hypothetical protein THAOC_08184, partial [Thalassiosira oceanica]
MVRDVEDHGEEPIAEEVALDLMTKVRCVDEPGEDALSVTDEEAPAAAVILAQVEAHAEAQVGAQVEARDDRDSGEDGQPMTTDPYNFDDTDSEAGTPSKPRSTPTNAPDQPSANYNQEWLQTSPPPDPSVPTPKRDSRNRQSTGYQTPAAHIHVQVYGYPPARNGHGGYHPNVYMDSDSEDGHGHNGDDASSGGYHSNGIDSDEYEFASCNYYHGDKRDVFFWVWGGVRVQS